MNTFVVKHFYHTAIKNRTPKQMKTQIIYPWFLIIVIRKIISLRVIVQSLEWCPIYWKFSINRQGM